MKETAHLLRVSIFVIVIRSKKEQNRKRLSYNLLTLPRMSCHLSTLTYIIDFDITKIS